MNVFGVILNVLTCFFLINYTRATGEILQFLDEKIRNLFILDNSYRLLPPIFHIDDYEQCKDDGKLFCKVTVRLELGKTRNESVWKIITDLSKRKTHYKHDELFHAICVEDFCPAGIPLKDNHELSDKLSECYSKKYQHLGLGAKVIKTDCKNHDDIYKMRIFDLILLIIVVIYLLYTIFATVQDFKQGDEWIKKPPSPKVLTWVQPFSLRGNWKKLRKINTSPDFQKLKCIQGIRFYNTLLIIFCHTVSSFIGGFVENTEYFEEIHHSFLRLGIRNLLIFLVQTFFLFSAFLVSFHIFQIMHETKTFNVKTVYLSFLNRYLRIIPPVLVMIAFGSSIWIVNQFYGPIKDLYSDVEFQRCQKNWWTTLLFISNHYNHHDMCYFITWYLSADTQLYALSLVVLSIIWTMKRFTKQIIGFCIGIGVLVPTIISYVYNLDVIYKITPENSKNNNYRCFAFNAIYSSTYANMATYMVGIGFGYVYFKYRDQNIIKNKLLKVIWLTSFFGIPLLVVVATFSEYSRVYSAILSGILKPLFATGIAIGVIGMSHKLGGIIRSVCEWKFAVFMGNFTYSTYVVHYGIVFYRTAVTKKPLYVSDFVLGLSFVQDVILSFFCGFLMHILVEMPALHLQNIFVPQVRKLRKTRKNN